MPKSNDSIEIFQISPITSPNSWDAFKDYPDKFINVYANIQAGKPPETGVRSTFGAMTEVFTKTILEMMEDDGAITRDDSSPSAYRTVLGDIRYDQLSRREKAEIGYKRTQKLVDQFHDSTPSDLAVTAFLDNPALPEAVAKEFIARMRSLLTELQRVPAQSSPLGSNSIKVSLFAISESTLFDTQPQNLGTAQFKKGQI